MEAEAKLGYDINNILEAFELETSQKCQAMDEWLNAKFQLTEMEAKILSDLHQQLNESVRDWNEEELKINFMGLLFYVAKINLAKKIIVFFERIISAPVQGHRLTVKADCLIASGAGRGGVPKTPYFFLQEFKRKKGDKEDPEGQMLTAMLIAQELNKDDKPLYGAWLHGNDWTFATLVGKSYCISREYDTTQIADLYTIVYSFRKLKELILENY